MRRIMHCLICLHHDERGIEGLEKLLIVAAITLPLLGLLIVFRNELREWVQSLWGQALQDARSVP